MAANANNRHLYTISPVSDKGEKLEDGDMLRVVKIPNKNGKGFQWMAEKITTHRKVSIIVQDASNQPPRVVIRVHFTDGSYKSVMILQSATAKELCQMVASKLRLEAFSSHFILTEMGKDASGKEFVNVVPQTAKPAEIQQRWVDPAECKFVFSMKQDSKDRLSRKWTRKISDEGKKSIQQQLQEDKPSDPPKPSVPQKTNDPPKPKEAPKPVQVHKEVPAVKVQEVKESKSSSDDEDKDEDDDELDNMLASLEVVVKKHEAKSKTDKGGATHNAIPDLDTILGQLASEIDGM